MEKRIELEKRGRSADQIKEICLDNCRSPTIVGLDESFVNLEILSMINIGLTTLKGFPKLPNLKRLELSDNRIQSNLGALENSPNLEYLNLCGNRIKDMDTLAPLKKLEKLEILDLFNCEITEIEDYRKLVFNLLPSLKYLDGYDRENKEIEDDDEEEGLHDDEEDENVDEADGEGNDEGNDSDVDDESDDEGEEDEDADDLSSSDDENAAESDSESDAGLEYLNQENIDEEQEEDNFIPGEEESDHDSDIDEDDEDDAQVGKGEKRKLPDGGDETAD